MRLEFELLPEPVEYLLAGDFIEVDRLVRCCRLSFRCLLFHVRMLVDDLLFDAVIWIDDVDGRNRCRWRVEER